ncbi:hypothetical protein GCM10027395_02520 [Giesbergeria sinuosa]
MEPNETARDALAIAGLLMILAEVAAFFIAALLPSRVMRSLRWLLLGMGLLLMAFETVTVFTTQQVLMQSSEASRAGTQARIDYLYTSIAKAQQSAIAMRQTAQEQVGSRFINQRQDGAQLLQAAQALEAQADAQAVELARLLAQQQHTLAQALGHSGTIAYNTARAVLMSITGLVLMSTAGVLLRANCALPVLATVPTVPAQAQNTVLPSVGTVPDWGKWLMMTGTAITPSSVVWAMPVPTVPAQTVPPEAQQHSPVLKPVAVPATEIPSTPTATDQRYAKVRAAVLGGMNPSVRAIQELVGGSTGTARELQAELLAEGVIKRWRKSYRTI